MIRICLVCGKEIDCKPSQVRKYCSNECKGFHQRQKLEEKIGCNLKEWLYQKYVIEIMSLRQISALLYDGHTYHSNVKYWMDEFEIPMRHKSEAVKVSWTNDNDRKTNASSLMTEKRNLDKIRRTDRYKRWRKLVLERDNNTCQRCKNTKEETFDIHHLYSLNTHDELKFDVDNGVTLCTKCHMYFHSIYRYGNNTKEQFKEFMKAD